MATIHNEIIIKAPAEKIWSVLATPDLLEKYDPTVRKSSLISDVKTDRGAKRKVEMRDGKNWFEEVITVCQPASPSRMSLQHVLFPFTSLSTPIAFKNSMDKPGYCRLWSIR